MSSEEEAIKMMDNDIEEQLRSEKTETLIETKQELENLVKKVKQELKRRK